MSPQEELETQIRKLRSVYEAARGLCMGYDWNNGTAAKACGYRRKLLSAVNAIDQVPDFEGKYRGTGDVAQSACQHLRKTGGGSVGESGWTSYWHCSDCGASETHGGPSLPSPQPEPPPDTFRRRYNAMQISKGKGEG